MSVQKVGTERLLGIGEYFQLGDVLLREFSEARDMEKGGDNVPAAVLPSKDMRRRTYLAKVRRIREEEV